MDGGNRRNERLVALCLLGWLLFNYPVLALFNRATLVLGIPLVYAYIFGAWALLIALIALVVRNGVGPRRASDGGSASSAQRTADSSATTASAPR
jgi:hypothetical protein